MDPDGIKKQKTRLVELRRKVALARTKAQELVTQTRSQDFWSAIKGDTAVPTPVQTHADYLAEYQQIRSVNEAAISALMKESESLPKATGQHWDQPRSLRIGIVADEFLYRSLQLAADFRPITPDNYELVADEIDLFLVVSTWRGLNGEWTGVAGQKSARRKLLEETIIPLVKGKGVPVVFYSKEDPPNYKQFLSLAMKADYIFTSAEEMIPQYKKDLNREVPIEALRFGVNYKLHNPLGCLRHKGRELIFAGSWMAHKYPERAETGTKIFDGILDSDSPFYVVDRNLDLDPKKFKNLERYMYPEKYLPNLHAPIEHESLQRLQKLLPLAINLNSVVNSQTMFANRIVELLAMGTLILSNHSAGVNTRYPYVQILDSQLDTEQFLNTLTPEYLQLCQSEGIRDIFLNDTAFDRVDQILSLVGFESQKPTHRIIVVCANEQMFADFKNSQATELPLTFVSNANVDKIVGQGDGDVVLFPENIKFRSPDLVNDAVAAFRYSNVDALIYSTYDDLSFPAYEPSSENPGKGHPHVIWLQNRETLKDKGIGSYMGVLTSEAQKSASRTQFDPSISIVVPTYNNGKHLIHKCFQSIRRSSIFSKAEVIIVDDGSTDTKTIASVDLLEKTQPNVRVFRFEDGGSGSASRPRNKGLELARAPYITYLDPDNEQVNDGFSVLLDLVRKESSDFAIGSMIRFKSGRSLVNNSRYLRNAIAKSPDLNGFNQKLLMKLDYKPMSIQALVADTSWLRSIGISQPIGAVGQDSYFFQQMLFYAKKIELTTLPIHIYYAEVANSTVNSVSPNFYRKYLPLEKARSEWLKQIGLFDHYKATRFRDFLEHWYIHKLQYTAPNDLHESIRLIEQLAGFYSDGKDEDTAISDLIQKAKETTNEC